MAEPLVLANPTPTLRLDLACGQSPRDGFEGVDLLAPNAKHRVDLMKFPWPWVDSSVVELHSSHFIEHIECRLVEARDLSDPAGAHFVGQDMLLAFFDECYRILIPGGAMRVIAPCGRSNRAFQDPTHRRFIVQETFGYLNKSWRDVNKLDHYRVKCDFASTVGMIIPQEMSVLHAEVQARRFASEWNVIQDWVADLKSAKV